MGRVVRRVVWWRTRRRGEGGEESGVVEDERGGEDGEKSGVVKDERGGEDGARAERSGDHLMQDFYLCPICGLYQISESGE